MYSYKTNIAPASLVIQHKNTPAVAKRGEKDPIYLKSKSSASGLQFIFSSEDEKSVILENLFFLSTVFPQNKSQFCKTNYVLTEEGF